MFKIFCDETWTIQSDFSKVQKSVIVFYGVMLEACFEEELLQKIETFKKKRGLFPPISTPVEIKWQKVEDEWQEAIKKGKRNRYEEFLDIFFDEVKSKRLSFGYMFLNKGEYDYVESKFLEKQCDNKHNFFFMMYFQFLYHCFIKNQVKQQPCEICIDDHDMGGEGQRYDIERLREVLNKRIDKDHIPKGQLWLSGEMKRRLVNSIQFVSLADSKNEPLVQLADLCAGCVRYILENQITPPTVKEQLSLFESNIPREVHTGRDYLADHFYRKLTMIRDYKNINLQDISYHHRFSIFPFSFQR